MIRFRVAACSILAMVALNIVILLSPPMPSPFGHAAMMYGSSLLMMLLLFLPGSLFPVRWPEVAAMAALAVIATVIETNSTNDMNELLHIKGTAINTFGVLLLFTLGETIRSKGFAARPLIAVSALACSAGMVYLVFFQFAVLTGTAFMVPGQSFLSFNTIVTVSGLPFSAALGWSSILVGIRIADRWRTTSLIWAIAGACTVSATVLSLTLWHWTPYFACSILETGNPVPRVTGVRLLTLYGSESDSEYLWNLLADRRLATPSEPTEYPIDSTSWRAIVIDVLIDKDDAPAIERLAATVRRNPCRALVSETAGLLSANRRFETAPELMRWALYADDRCLRALEQMHVREVAMPLVYYSTPIASMDRNSIDRGQAPFGKTSGLENLDRRVASILRHAVLPEQAETWLDNYEDRLNAIPASLDAAQEKEVRQVISAFVTQRLAQFRFRACFGGTRQCPTADWSIPTTAALVTEAEALAVQIDEAIHEHTTAAGDPVTY